MEHLRYYDDYVKDGHYINDQIFTHFSRTFHELNGSVWGILGLGAIGRRVADIAGMFGADVIYSYSASGVPHRKDIIRWILKPCFAGQISCPSTRR